MGIVYVAAPPSVPAWPAIVPTVGSCCGRSFTGIAAGGIEGGVTAWQDVTVKFADAD